VKSFYSCIDSTLIVPQPVQHLVIRDYATKVGGSIVFYGAEEAKTRESQAFVRAKLKRTPGIDGVCFFTFHQFRYGQQLNIDLLQYILSLNLEIHFAREALSINSIEELDRAFAFIYSIDYTLRRDSSAEWKSFLKEVEVDLKH
jgi:hypothetical protein